MTIIALYSIVLQVGISSDRIAGMAQSVERRIGSAEVTGPIPVASLTGKKAVILDFSRVTAFLVAGIRKKLPVAGSVGNRHKWVQMRQNKYRVKMGVKSRRGKDLLVVIVENKYKKEDTSQTSNDDNILPLTSETHLDTVSFKKYYIIC